MMLFLFQRDVLALCTNLITLELYGVFCIIPGFEELYDPAGSGALRSEVIENFEGVCCRIRVQPTIAQYICVCVRARPGLIEVCGLDCLVGLQSSKFEGNEQRSKLCSLSSLHTLCCSHLDMDEVPGVDSLVGVKIFQLRMEPTNFKAA